MQSADPICYILAISRSVGPAQPVALHRDIAQNLKAAAEQTGRPYTVISPSDSTLRGSFPAEADALAEMAQSRAFCLRKKWVLSLHRPWKS